MFTENLIKLVVEMDTEEIEWLREGWGHRQQ